MPRSALVSGQRYTAIAIAFHWTIAALVIVNLTLGLLHDAFEPVNVMPAHKAIGITVLVLSLGRLAWRLMNPPPPLPATTAPWERRTAAVTHGIFYALLLILPLTGWMMASGGAPPKPLNWFGMFPIPYLPVDKAAADFGHEAHEILGILMAALVLLHIGAALRHHLVLRDSVLLRMFPLGR